VILDIAGAHASWSDNKLHVWFDVIPEERFHLDLKTGEIFQSDRYAVGRDEEDKAISATLFVGRREHNAAGAEFPSEMRYVPGIVDEWKSWEQTDSEIRLTWLLPDDHLAGFHALVLAGKTPRAAFIDLAHGKLEYGWEPDGSGQTWDNEKHPSIPIENVSFKFDLLAPPSDQPLNTEFPEGYDRAFFSDAARVNFALLRKLSSIESSLGRLSWHVGIIALIVLGLALSRFWH